MDSESTMQRADIDDGANATYWDTVKHNGHDHPEQDLMLAVLRDALRDYRKQLRRPKKAWTDDRQWFFANERDRLFSFESICTVLGLDAQTIRDRLRAWERGSHARPGGGFSVISWCPFSSLPTGAGTLCELAKVVWI